MTARNFQNLRTTYWDSARNRGNPLTPDEMLVELYLITCPQCGPSGAFITSPGTISYYTGISLDVGQGQRDLWGSEKIGSILASLEAKKRIKAYSGGWVWVIGKWEFESKSPSVQKALYIELESTPGCLIRDFLKLYQDTLTETVPDRVSNRVSDSSPHTKSDHNRSDHSLAPTGTPAPTSFPEKPKEKKPYVPLRLQKASTPGRRCLRYWHAEYHRVHGEEYAGDAKVMAGQIAQLLRQGHPWLKICAAMYAFLDADSDKFTNWHNFDTFIKRYSKWSAKATEEGYEIEAAEDGEIPGAESE